MSAKGRKNIEGEAKADLISLIDGALVSNAPDAVAHWALKTAYVFTVATDPPVGRVPQRHMVHLKQRSGLPPGVAVFFRTDSEPEWWFSSSTRFVVEADEVSAAEMQNFGLRHCRNADLCSWSSSGQTASTPSDIMSK